MTNSIHGHLPENYRKASLEYPFSTKQVYSFPSILASFSILVHCLLEQRIISEAQSTHPRYFDSPGMPLYFIKDQTSEHLCHTKQRPAPLSQCFCVLRIHKSLYTNTWKPYKGIPAKVPHNAARHDYQQSPTNISTCFVEKN